MSIVSEVKCARCDRRYSGVRSRCPYCGARRIGRGKYSEEPDNSKGKMLIGVMIMGVLVVAVGVLLFTAPKPQPEPETPPESSEPTGGIPDDEANISVTGIIPVMPSPDDDEESDDLDVPPAPTVQSVMITYGGKENNDFSANVGDKVTLKAKIEPLGVEETVLWSSSDPSIFEVVATNAEGTQAVVTGIGKGNGVVTVSVGGVEDTCIVRIREK